MAFVPPRGVDKGRYRLRSISPSDVGKVPSVRVDRDMDDSVISADNNTSGFPELEAFSGGGSLVDLM